MHMRLHVVAEDLLPIQDWVSGFNRNADLENTVIYEPPPKNWKPSRAILDIATADEPEPRRTGCRRRRAGFVVEFRCGIHVAWPTECS